MNTSASAFADLPPRILSHIASTDAILFHRAIANRLNLKPTDYRCLLFMVDGPKTPTELAEMSGLTTGSITTAIGRLEKLGYVRRAPAGKDKRRIYVQNIPEVLRPLYAGLGSFIAEMQELDRRYAPEEMIIINDYSHRVANILHDLTLRVAQNAPTLRED
ncbi:MAG TPA: MarR family transcriptional regulator [Candidatus Saccharimonadales bacterium]